MKWVLIVLGALATLVVMVLVIGVLLPVGHTARVRARYDREPAEVWAAVTDVVASASWRDAVDRVEILSSGDEPLRWREHTTFGPMTYEAVTDEAPGLFSARIADTGQGFGGTWTWAIEPGASGSILTITEDGEVYNPFFRFMARFVFGHHATMETYARELGRHFGQEVEPERLE